MPNGQTEYEKWYEALPGWLRGLATPPVEIAGREQPGRLPRGQPTPREITPISPSPLAWEALAGLTPEERAGLPFPIPEEPIMQQILRRRRAGEEAAAVKLPGAPGFETFAEAFGSLPNENWEVYKNEFGRFDVRRKKAPAPLPTGLTPAQQAAQELAEQEAAQRRTEWETEQQRIQREWEAQQAQWEWERGQVGQVTPIQEQQFGFQQQQFEAQQRQFQQTLQFQQQQAQLMAQEQERQYRSQLAQSPISWLQYAAYTGEQPVIQPWMKPLGFQDMGDVFPQGFQVGQPLPGFQGQGETFTNLPALTTPSAQLQARWGPTAQAQFLGYRQARTGARPEETQFRLGAGAPPTGAFGGFSRFR